MPCRSLEVAQHAGWGTDGGTAMQVKAGGPEIFGRCLTQTSVRLLILPGPKMEANCVM